MVGDRLPAPGGAQHRHRLVEDRGPLRALDAERLLLVRDRRRRARTPAAAVRRRAGRGWRAPSPAPPGCAPAAPSRSSRTSASSCGRRRTPSPPAGRAPRRRCARSATGCRSAAARACRRPWRSRRRSSCVRTPNPNPMRTFIAVHRVTQRSDAARSGASDGQRPSRSAARWSRTSRALVLDVEPADHGADDDDRHDDRGLGNPPEQQHARRARRRR